MYYRNFEHLENVLFVEDPFDTDFNVTRSYISNAWKNCCKASFQVTIRWFDPQFKPRLLDILGTPVWSYLPYSIPYSPPHIFFTHPMLSQLYYNFFSRCKQSFLISIETDNHKNIVKTQYVQSIYFQNSVLHDL